MSTRVVEKISEMRELARELPRTVGLVPTMGALHAGHMGLIRRCREDSETAVVSVFVNPTQFGPSEDYQKYPRDLAADMEKCREAGVDVVFAPTAEEMYPEGYSSAIEVGGVTNKMCGLSRPGHFRGVTTVVCKLLNIVRPERAYFGQKDAQQLVVVKRMAEDLNVPVEIVRVPIVREPDGLATSSRNAYLSPEEREDALSLRRALEHFAERVAEGEKDPLKLIGEMGRMIDGVDSARIDYIVVVDPETLEDLDRIEGGAMAALAVWMGSTRLIDNEVVG